MKEIFFQKVFDVLKENKNYHRNGSALYSFLKDTARQEVDKLYRENTHGYFEFPNIGTIHLPFYPMGNVSSGNLFDLDELIIFSFYFLNIGRYKRVADIGANLGLHSIILAKLGYTVDAYEPEDAHFAQLQNNVNLNGVKVNLNKVGISNRKGVAKFTKVLGNTTSSHISGSKPNPYGELEYTEISLLPFHEIIQQVDLVKMDVEGHEKEILLSTQKKDWGHIDAIVEISNPENACNVYDHFCSIGVNLFSQKTGWSKVSTLNDVPVNYKEGSIFISTKDAMPWNQ